MKKILFLLFVLFIGYGGFILYDNYLTGKIPKLSIEDEVSNISKLYIYGTHFNMTSSMVDDTNLDIVLYDGDFINYNINELVDYYNISDKVNEGIDLESIPLGKYYVFLRARSIDDDGNESYRYYALKNDTDYKDMTYYTFSNRNYKILITSDDEYNTLFIQVTKNDKTDVYDVVIDPGHGGIDSGASKNGYNEADYTMKIALDLKEKLEKKGMKVKLTREIDQLNKNQKLPDYGKNSRTAIGYESNSKYLFSIHLNSNSSSKVKGIEVYTPHSINYGLAEKIANNIVNKANTTYSSNRINKVMDGVYTRIFTEEDIKESKEDAAKLGRSAYDITTNTNYYFMIRETGGIVTGAYVDGRNSPKVPANPYYKSNIGVEAYLLELGYLTNISDTENVINNMGAYTDAISEAIYEVYNKNIDTK